MKIYNKLVRDNIPQIIEKDNKTPKYKILDNDIEYEKQLNNKLVEEINEYLHSNDIMELVDLGEIMHAILELKGISIEEYQKLRMKKLNERGSFKKRIFLESVE